LLTSCSGPEESAADRGSRRRARIKAAEGVRGASQGDQDRHRAEEHPAQLGAGAGAAAFAGVSEQEDAFDDVLLMLSFSG
jgi:hypothetical protein